MYVKIGLELLKLLNSNGYKAYIVGGFARDSYMDIMNDDIDICTNCKYENIINLFPDTVNNGFGSYVVKYKNFLFQVTTFRLEGKYLVNRFPSSFRFINSLRVDLLRRDFIMNTLCIDCNGRYVDLMGARDDIDSKVIRLIGRKTRLRDDSLRILRAIRFAAVYNFELDKSLSDGIEELGYLVGNLSYDKRMSELSRIFLSDNYEYGISLIKKFNLDKYLEIDVSNFNQASLYAMWALVDKNRVYSYSKKDRKYMDVISSLLEKNVDVYDLYIYGNDVIGDVAMLKSDIDVLALNRELVINNRNDICITNEEILELVSKNKVSKVFSSIEKEIVYGRLGNTNRKIKNFIKKNFTD